MTIKWEIDDPTSRSFAVPKLDRRGGCKDDESIQLAMKGTSAVVSNPLNLPDTRSAAHKVYQDSIAVQTDYEKRAATDAALSAGVPPATDPDIAKLVIEALLFGRPDIEAQRIKFDAMRVLLLKVGHPIAGITAERFVEAARFLLHKRVEPLNLG